MAAIETISMQQQSDPQDRLVLAVLRVLSLSRQGLRLKTICQSLQVSPEYVLAALRTLQETQRVQLAAYENCVRWRVTPPALPGFSREEKALRDPPEEDTFIESLPETRPFAGIRHLRVRTRMRPKTIECRRIPINVLAFEKQLWGTHNYERPSVFGDCEGIKLPCPFVGCRYNLYLDVNPETGSIKLNFPDLEPDQMDPQGSCALDVAKWEGLTLDEVGYAMNLTRERVRQIEKRGLRLVKEQLPPH